jgi:hypothetical protein
LPFHASGLLDLLVLLRYHGCMKTEPMRSPEFAKFDALVTQVLSVPKAKIQSLIAEDKRKPKPTKRKLKQPA